MTCKTAGCLGMKVHGSLYCFGCLPAILEARRVKRAAYYRGYMQAHRAKLNAYMRKYKKQQRSRRAGGAAKEAKGRP